MAEDAYKITFEIPAEAAVMLQQLAEVGSRGLTRLGILNVKVGEEVDDDSDEGELVTLTPEEIAEMTAAMRRRKDDEDDDDDLPTKENQLTLIGVSISSVVGLNEESMMEVDMKESGAEKRTLLGEAGNKKDGDLNRHSATNENNEKQTSDEIVQADKLQKADSQTSSDQKLRSESNHLQSKSSALSSSRSIASTQFSGAISSLPGMKNLSGKGSDVDFDERQINCEDEPTDTSLKRLKGSVVGLLGGDPSKIFSKKLPSPKKSPCSSSKEKFDKAFALCESNAASASAAGNILNQYRNMGGFPGKMPPNVSTAVSSTTMQQSFRFNQGTTQQPCNINQATMQLPCNINQATLQQPCNINQITMQQPCNTNQATTQNVFRIPSEPPPFRVPVAVGFQHPGLVRFPVVKAKTVDVPSNLPASVIKINAEQDSRNSPEPGTLTSFIPSVVTDLDRSNAASQLRPNFSTNLLLSAQTTSSVLPINNPHFPFLSASNNSTVLLRPASMPTTLASDKITLPASSSGIMVPPGLAVYTSGNTITFPGALNTLSLANFNLAGISRLPLNSNLPQTSASGHSAFPFSNNVTSNLLQGLNIRLPVNQSLNATQIQNLRPSLIISQNSSQPLVSGQSIHVGTATSIPSNLASSATYLGSVVLPNPRLVVPTPAVTISAELPVNFKPDVASVPSNHLVEKSDFLPRPQTAEASCAPISISLLQKSISDTSRYTVSNVASPLSISTLTSRANPESFTGRSLVVSEHLSTKETGSVVSSMAGRDHNAMQQNLIVSQIVSDNSNNNSNNNSHSRSMIDSDRNVDNRGTERIQRPWISPVKQRTEDNLSSDIATDKVPATTSAHDSEQNNDQSINRTPGGTVVTQSPRLPAKKRRLELSMSEGADEDLVVSGVGHQNEDRSLAKSIIAQSLSFENVSDESSRLTHGGHKDSALPLVCHIEVDLGRKSQSGIEPAISKSVTVTNVPTTSDIMMKNIAENLHNPAKQLVDASGNDETTTAKIEVSPTLPRSFKIDAGLLKNQEIPQSSKIPPVRERPSLWIKKHEESPCDSPDTDLSSPADEDKEKSEEVNKPETSGNIPAMTVNKLSQESFLSFIRQKTEKVMQGRAERPMLTKSLSDDVPSSQKSEAQVRSSGSFTSHEIGSKALNLNPSLSVPIAGSTSSMQASSDRMIHQINYSTNERRASSFSSTEKPSTFSSIEPLASSTVPSVTESLTAQSLSSQARSSSFSMQTFDKSPSKEALPLKARLIPPRSDDDVIERKLSPEKILHVDKDTDWSRYLRSFSHQEKTERSSSFGSSQISQQHLSSTRGPEYESGYTGVGHRSRSPLRSSRPNLSAISPGERSNIGHPSDRRGSTGSTERGIDLSQDHGSVYKMNRDIDNVSVDSNSTARSSPFHQPWLLSQSVEQSKIGERGSQREEAVERRRASDSSTHSQERSPRLYQDPYRGQERSPRFDHQPIRDRSPRRELHQTRPRERSPRHDIELARSEEGSHRYDLNYQPQERSSRPDLQSRPKDISPKYYPHQNRPQERSPRYDLEVTRSNERSLRYDFHQSRPEERSPRYEQVRAQERSPRHDQDWLVGRYEPGQASSGRFTSSESRLRESHYDQPGSGSSGYHRSEASKFTEDLRYTDRHSSAYNKYNQRSPGHSSSHNISHPRSPSTYGQHSQHFEDIRTAGSYSGSEYSREGRFPEAFSHSTMAQPGQREYRMENSEPGFTRNFSIEKSSRGEYHQSSGQYMEPGVERRTSGPQSPRSGDYQGKPQDPVTITEIPQDSIVEQITMATPKEPAY